MAKKKKTDGIDGGGYSGGGMRFRMGKPRKATGKLKAELDRLKAETKPKAVVRKPTLSEAKANAEPRFKPAGSGARMANKIQAQKLREAIRRKKAKKK